jgi:hypothetical protein
MDAAQEKQLSDSDFAFPKERKEPIVDASHVRNAIARFDQVEGVNDRERDEAWKRIQQAAKRFGVKIEVDDWRELFNGGKEKRAETQSLGAMPSGSSCTQDSGSQNPGRGPISPTFPIAYRAM